MNEKPPVEETLPFQQGVESGRIDERLALVEIINKIEKQFYAAKPTSTISLHPFKILKQEINK
jgi:hypothetical protein